MVWGSRACPQGPGIYYRLQHQCLIQIENSYTSSMAIPLITWWWYWWCYLMIHIPQRRKQAERGRVTCPGLASMTPGRNPSSPPSQTPQTPKPQNSPLPICVAWSTSQGIGANQKASSLNCHPIPIFLHKHTWWWDQPISERGFWQVTKELPERCLGDSKIEREIHGERWSEKQDGGRRDSLNTGLLMEFA